MCFYQPNPKCCTCTFLQLVAPCHSATYYPPPNPTLNANPLVKVCGTRHISKGVGVRLCVICEPRLLGRMVLMGMGKKMGMGVPNLGPGSETDKRDSETVCIDPALKMESMEGERGRGMMRVGPVVRRRKSVKVGGPYPNVMPRRKGALVSSTPLSMSESKIGVGKKAGTPVRDKTAAKAETKTETEASGGTKWDTDVKERQECVDDVLWKKRATDLKKHEDGDKIGKGYVVKMDGDDLVERRSLMAVM
ncbi:hypothetical protein BDW62DRAFT_197644 [Aspergillus aurantiobrunneus]